MRTLMPPFGVLLMTYGSPSSLNDVGRYLGAVRGGRDPGAELVAEFRRRYALIGGSPLIAITVAQAAALEVLLGGEAVVRAAMRFSAPSVLDALRELAEAGVSEVVGIVMSPQFSSLLMGGYRAALDDARTELGEAAPNVRVAGAWHTEPGFIEALAQRVREGLERFAPGERAGVPILLTAHSIPREVAEREPDYVAQLQETARAVAYPAGLSPDRWTFCWQSAGHSPGEWMKPDFSDLMPRLAADGHRAVLVAPVQFLADHLEILYDIDEGAREQAEAAGLRFARVEALNREPRFIEALASVARREIGGWLERERVLQIEQ
jgi:protoporphyrin/coproporphyrin ferrochelatase